MATQVLDAFVVTFGMDVVPYQKAAREIQGTSTTLREETKKTFDQVEQRGKSASLTFRNVRNDVVGMVLAFAGARSVADFALNMLHGEAAAGRLSQTLGIATSRLTAWQIATRQMGGQSGEADSALQSMQTAVQSFKLTGTTGHDADLLGLGVTQRDLLQGDPSALLLKIASASERMSKPEFAARLQRIGLPQSTIYLLEQGRRGLQQQLDAAEKLAGVTEKDAKAAGELDSKLAQLQTTLQGLVRPYLTNLVSGFIEFVNWMEKSQLVIPAVTGLLGALGVAAVAATWPWLALAGAIGSVVIAYNDLQRIRHMSPQEREKFEARGAELRSKIAGQLGKGDLRGALSTIWEGFSERAGDAMGGGSPSAPSAAAQARGNAVQDYMQRSGFSPEVSKGISAGVFAEGGGLGMAANGAFGIGQWRGDRYKRLISRYGPAPSMQQQLEFLAWELHGGDKQSLSVGRQVTADHALLAYVTDAMRPQGANWEHKQDWLGDIARGRKYLAGSGGGGGAVHIGQINVHTRATDAQGIARDIGAALRNRGAVVQADAGVAP